MKKPSPNKAEQPSSAAGSLLITRQQKAPLTKQQAAFNKLVAKVAELKQQLDQRATDLEKMLAYYHKHILPLLEQERVIRQEYTTHLFTYYRQTKPSLFSKREKMILRELISEQVDILLSLPGEPDEELGETFKAMKGVTFEEAEQLELDSIRDDVEAVFKEFGFDQRPENRDREVPVEEMVKILKDNKATFQQFSERSGDGYGSAKKTKKQQAKEAKDKELQEVRTKNISVIYKQLAKVFHPDLEQDPGKKSEKEELMKQLTVAYEKNDLYSLLTLELAWIHQEENHLHSMAENKLALYNDVLKEQVRNLQNEIFFQAHHPRFDVLQQLVPSGVLVTSVDLVTEKQECEWVIRDLKQDMPALKGSEKTAVQLIRAMILQEEADRRDEQFGLR